MTLIRTAEPAVEPIPLPGMKEHLRVAHDSEDALIAGLIKAAREEVERSTSLALINQSWRLAVDRMPRNGILKLQKNPIIEILAVTAFDDQGEDYDIPPEYYRLSRSRVPAQLNLNLDIVATPKWSGLELDFTAGFGDSADDVPEGLKRAMMILVSHWFEFRGAYGAKDQPVSIPDEYLRLIANYRTPRL